MFWNDPDYVKYEFVDDEPRWTIIGHTSLLRALVVVWTARRGTARMLSEAFGSPVLPVRLSEGDAAKVRRRAAEHGQDESAYIAALVHEALQQRYQGWHGL